MASGIQRKLREQLVEDEPGNVFPTLRATLVFGYLQLIVIPITPAVLTSGQGPALRGMPLLPISSPNRRSALITPSPQPRGLNCERSGPKTGSGASTPVLLSDPDLLRGTAAVAMAARTPTPRDPRGMANQRCRPLRISEASAN